MAFKPRPSSLMKLKQ